MRSDGYKGGTATRLTVLLLLVVPAALLAYIGYRQTERNQTKLVIERREAVAYLAAATLKERFDGIVDLGTTLASRDEFRADVERGAWDSALRRVEDIPTRFPAIERVTITSSTGTMLADSLGEGGVVGQNFAFRDWYLGVSREWKPYVSSTYLRRGQPQLNVVTAAIPIRSATGGDVLAVLGLQLPLDTFFDWSSDFDVGPRGFVYYVDQRGQIATHPRYPPQDRIVDYSSVPAVQRALAGGQGVDVLYNPVEDETALAAWAQVPEYGWGVVVSQDVATAFAERTLAMRNLLVRNLSYLLLILLAALALMRLLNRLERQAQRERVFLDSLGEGVAVTDRAGKVAFMNPAALQIFRLKPQDVLGKPWQEIAAQPTDLKGRPIPEAERAFLAAQRGQTATVTYRYQRKDGTSLPAVVTTAPIVFEGDIIGVINVFRDITTEVELERERSELLSIASHQMRTPLTAMRWNAEMLLRGDAGKLTRDQRTYVSDLLETNGRLTGLVNDMLNVSRLEAEKTGSAAASTDLVALLKDAAKEIGPLAKEKRQALVTRLPKKPIMLTIDARMFSQAVLNLLSNAVKYTPERGQVLLEAETDVGVVRIQVRDSGIGIPTDQQSQLFAKFFRAENAIASGVEGTGLGLYVVKKVVELAGGKISFVSVPGEGTTFTVTLPLAQA